MLFSFTITFPEETETDAESFSDDLEENGLGNYTTEVKEIVDKNRKFACEKTHCCSCIQEYKKNHPNVYQEFRWCRFNDPITYALYHFENLFAWTPNSIIYIPLDISHFSYTQFGQYSQTYSLNYFY